MFDLKFECYQLATEILEREPCSSEPALYEKYRASLSRQIEKAIEAWFDSSEDDVQGE